MAPLPAASTATIQSQISADNTIRRPAFMLACFAVFQLLLITAVPTLLTTAPPLDVVEGWTWAPHWLIGTYKHPPGPAWSIETMHFLIPGYFLGPYLLSQISVALTYVFIYLTGRLLMDNARALAGTLLLSGSLYLTYTTTEFNHNVLQLPFWSSIILTFAHILKKPDRTFSWVALGALIGAGMYAKYSVCVIGIVVALAGLLFPRIRAQFVSFRPYLAVALACLIFLPHAMWLVANDFPPFKYVSDRTRSNGSPLEPMRFLLNQIVPHTPILALLIYVGRRTFASAERAVTDAETIAFLRIVTLGPVALLVVGALLSDKQLLTMWGMPMFTPVGLWMVAEFGLAWDRGMIKRLYTGATIMVAVVAVVIAGELTWSTYHKPKREMWPMAELAAKANAAWASEIDSPLEITGGNMWLAGLVSVGLPQKPDVAVGNGLDKSPWVRPEDISKKGMLYLSDVANPQLPAYCAAREPAHQIRLDDAHLAPVYATVCHPG